MTTAFGELASLIPMATLAAILAVVAYHMSGRSRTDGPHVFLSDVHAPPLRALRRSAAIADIGEENVFRNLDDALGRAREVSALPLDA